MQSYPAAVAAAITAAMASDQHKEGSVMYSSSDDEYGCILDLVPNETSQYVRFRRHNIVLTEAVPVVDHATVEWTVTDECIYRLDGDQLSKRFVGACKLYVPANGYTGDVCGWCGADNGSHGEFRQGFACCFCGGT